MAELDAALFGGATSDHWTEDEPRFSRIGARYKRRAR